MKNLIWVGPSTSFSNQIRQYLLTLPSRGMINFTIADNMDNNIPNNGLSPISTPFLILSENLETLLNYGAQHPNAFQIFLCTDNELWNSLSSSLRPINRFYFLKTSQSLIDFQKLIEKISALDHKKYSADKREKLKTNGTLSAMKNSLGVLSKLNDGLIQELTHFSQKEDERRKKFQSLIHLARSLSMSRDIEEVIHTLWLDLRTFKSIKEISFLIENKKQTYQQIVYRGGKFHFELISIQTPPQREFLKIFFQSIQSKELQPLNKHQTESLQFLQKKTFKNLYSYSLIDEKSQKPYALLLELNEKSTPDALIEMTLQERLSFIKLTLEKYLLQEEVQAKTNLWASTFDDLNDPLAIFTEKKSIVRANNRFFSLFGSDNEFNLSRKSKYELKENSEFDLLWNELPKQFNQSLDAEVHFKNKIYRYQVFPIQNTQKPEPKAFITHYIDITTERTLYSRLLQSEKMIAIGKLAENLTSALSLPLNTILQLVDKTNSIAKLPSHAKNDLNEINKATLRSLKIIKDFINFSEGNIEKSYIEAETIIEITIPLIKSLIHGHRFQLQLSEQRHFVHVSVSLIQQVLYNLLRNANQALNDSGLIKISTETQSLQNVPGVQISIIDSGKGVPEELKPRLFQPLVTTKGNEGTGLGLNFVKQIIENHKGSVGYEPLDGVGSKFWIWLPIKKT